jgi:periplasmic divalent cation tolerance protein
VGRVIGNTSQGREISFLFHSGGNMVDKDPILLVLITAPDLETAQSLARELVAKKVAACVNISPGITSIYSWKGQVEEDQEVLLLVKTREGLLKDQLIPLVQDLHPYDLPEIISLPITGGSQAYLQWIRDETGGALS